MVTVIRKPFLAGGVNRRPGGAGFHTAIRENYPDDHHHRHHRHPRPSEHTDPRSPRVMVVTMVTVIRKRFPAGGVNRHPGGVGFHTAIREN